MITEKIPKNNQETTIQDNYPIVVGLDIGTTKTVIMVAKKTIHNKIEIIGLGHHEAIKDAVHHGEVININDTALSIQEALKDCYNSNPNIEHIDEVYVGISGKHIKTTRTHDKITRQNPNDIISAEEVLRFIDMQYKTYVPNNTKIIDVIPENFEVDQRPVKRVEGTCGVRLGANFHIITADEDAMKMINMSVDRAGLKTLDLVLQPLASTAAVLSEYEYESNVAIVDIGGGTTDITVLKEGEVHHTAVIPLGGIDFTNDIHRGLRLPLYRQAEELKKRYGCVLPEMIKPNKYITISAFKNSPAIEIEAKKLAEILRSRAMDIMENIYRELYPIGLSDGNIDTVILTGGGSQLRYLEELAKYKLNIDVHIGIPDEHLATGHNIMLKNPAYATCIGLLLRGFEDFEINQNLGKESTHLPPTKNTVLHTNISDVQISTSKVNTKKSKSWFDISDQLNRLKGGIFKTFGENIEDKPL